MTDDAAKDGELYRLYSYMDDLEEDAQEMITSSAKVLSIVFVLPHRVKPLKPFPVRRPSL